MVMECIGANDSSDGPEMHEKCFLAGFLVSVSC